jgi:hypothetical protein
MNIGVWVLLAFFFISLYVLIRNEWVYRQRTKQSRANLPIYMKMISYDKMLFKYFWCWNFEKLKQKRS